MKQVLLIILTLSTLGASAQSVHIPDANFRSCLLSNFSINSNGDNEITTAEAAAFTGTLDCSNRNINDLTGIAAFTALTELQCYSNNLSSLDLRQNTALTKLFCNNNALSSLDLSQNNNLNFVYCHRNQLTSLNVANGNNANINLTSFDATDNPNLSCIQVDNVAYSNATWVFKDNTASYSIDCGPFVNIPDANFKTYLRNDTAINTNGDGEISIAEAAAFTGSIGCVNYNISDLTGIEAFTALTQLFCYGNTLSSLDLRQNTALTLVQCYQNDLTSLEIGQNSALEHLTCSDNDLTNLDLSQASALTLVDCRDNQLTSLNMANGNNMNINGFSFNARNNPNLNCIEVDNVAYSNTHWTNKDATASYSTNCSLSIDDFSAEVSVFIFPNPASSQLTLKSTQTITAITLMDMTGKEIAEPELNNNSIDISYLSKGLYFLQIETTGGSVTEKFVKR